MRVVFAGGGTGGHVYPNLSVAAALRSQLAARGEALDALYIGVHGRADERIVPAAGMPFTTVAAGPLRVASPLRFVANLLRLAVGVLQATVILARFRPRAVFATGGYASVPVGIAARLLRRPLVVYLPDVTPGWAVRLLARLATRVTTTSERSLARLPAARASVVGYPVRPEFWSLRRDGARTHLALPTDAKVLLVAPGSLGARAINDALRGSLEAIAEHAYVLLVAGDASAGELAADLPQPTAARMRQYGYLPELPAAMVAADLFVGRAGASTLGELPAAGLPAVLVPGEYEGWSQAPNADYLRAHGAAVVVPARELQRLPEAIIELLRDDAARARMRDAMRSLARPDAADALARTLLEVGS